MQIEALTGPNEDVLSALLGMQQQLQGEEQQNMEKVGNLTEIITITLDWNDWLGFANYLKFPIETVHNFALKVSFTQRQLGNSKSRIG